MGENLDISYGFGYSPFGKTMIANTKKGICSLEFYEDSYEKVLNRLQSTWKNAKFSQDNKRAQELLDNIFIKKTESKPFCKRN